jgi:hypothetical protein
MVIKFIKMMTINLVLSRLGENISSICFYAEPKVSGAKIQIKGFYP